jgi:YfiH family protein
VLQIYRNTNVTFLRSPALDRVPGVVHAFSTRRGVDDNFSFGRDVPAGTENREHFLSAIGLPGWPLGRVRQTHSNIVHAVRDNAFVNEQPEGDALHTAVSGLALGVMTADCAPILIAERRARAVAAVHAGWRGTSEGVGRRAVESLVAEGMRASDLTVAIGPHIGVCCMEVGEEVYDWFAQPDVFERRPEWEKPHLNVAKANTRQLVDAGVPEERIQVSTLCTRCRRDLFYSYRRDGAGTGRMLAAIGIDR